MIILTSIRVPGVLYNKYNAYRGMGTNEDAAINQPITIAQVGNQ